MPGYTGENCLTPCPYPYYGVDCQKECKCSNGSCDISTGCISLTTESKTTAAQPISDVVTNTSHTIEISTFLYVGNNTVSTEKSRKHENTQQPSTRNDKIILCIQIFGCLDILLICIYSAVCIYDRQNRTLEMVDTNKSVPGNNSTYENAEIFSSQQQETNYCNVAV